MAPPHNSRSLARIRVARPQLAQPAPNAKTESIQSDEPAPRTSVILDIGAVVVPQFDLEKTFPAILAPFSLLRRIPESQDIDALRALTPVFSHCLDAILHSLTHLPERVPTSPKYHLALSGVNFSKDMFLGHVGHIPLHDQPSSHREAIHVAMHFLDMAMSSLKGFLKAAAYEVAQSKPLPQIPVEGNLFHVAEESEASTSLSHSSLESHRLGSKADTFTSNSTDPTDRSAKSSFSALLKPLSLRYRRKKKPSRPYLAGCGSATSSTLVNSDSDDLGCGYVHISIDIRNSLAQFPISIDPTVGKTSHPEDVTELWKDRNGLAQLASLKALVRYMTSPDADSDVEIVDVFFLCFRFFSNPKETFHALAARYDENLGRQSPSMARSQSMQVKIRIARLLYLWVDLHWRAEDAEVLTSLIQFAHSRLARDIPREAFSLLFSSLHQRARAGEKSRGHRMQKTITRAEAKYRQELLSSTWEPREKKAMMRHNFSRVKLEHFHSRGGHVMLALQMTLLLWEKYSAFEPEDAVRYLMTRNGDDNPPTSEVARKVANFMAYERAVHRFVMNSIGTAESVQRRIKLTEFFVELATKCHELRNYSASCLIALACDRPTVLPFIAVCSSMLAADPHLSSATCQRLKLSPAHERMKTVLRDFYTQENHHMAGHKQALQSCCCPALPGMMLFIREVARGCGSGPYDQHPAFPGSRLINLKRYRPITPFAVMEKCHTPFKIRRVDYIRDWLEHVLSEYLVGTEAEWEQRIYNNWCVNCSWTCAGTNR
ncbi:ras guanine nucleotide exchange factor domain-containing protein [Butyriboletus roseoflavus]|nr:ras guanine nucleotide exchange factor domain-containing protein [Butyriboletus roseoflavus]